VSHTDPLPIPMRDRLLLAYACTQWAGALTHLTALRQVGCRVPDEVSTEVEYELSVFTNLLNKVNGEDRTPMDVAEQARTWLTNYTEELDALLKEEEPKWAKTGSRR
jgi:hypothetical protein